MDNTLEFNGSPQPVTLREKRLYSFDLTSWLGEGQSLGAKTVRLVDSNGNLIENAATVAGGSGNTVNVEVDWTVSGIKTGYDYYLFLHVMIGTHGREGYARFTTFGL